MGLSADYVDKKGRNSKREYKGRAFPQVSQTGLGLEALDRGDRGRERLWKAELVSIS